MTKERLKGRAAQIAAAIRSYGPASVRALTDRTGIPRSSVARVCENLVDEGLLERRDTSPITYHPTPDLNPPSWVQPPGRPEIEPMCKALFEAARAEVKMDHDTTVIEECPAYLAAAEVYS